MCPIEEMPIGSKFVVQGMDGVCFEVLGKAGNITVQITNGEISEKGDVEPGAMVSPIWFPVFRGDDE